MLITIQWNMEYGIWNMEYGIWNMKYVSLGSSCSVAYQLQKLNKRNIAYPFDWLRCETLDNITNCFGNNFSDFITSCHIVSKSDKFPLSTNDDFPCIDNQSKAISLCMQNKYNMKFYHDFTDGSDMDTIDLKYQRRINRLRRRRQVLGVGDAERRVLRAEQLVHRVVVPRGVAKLERDADLGRELREKIAELSRVDLHVVRELKEDRRQRRPEEPRPSEQLREVLFGADEALVVGYLLRGLEGVAKPRWRRGGPGGDHLRFGHRAEGVVDLDGGVALRVVREHLRLRELRRVERALPLRVAVPARADPEHDPGAYAIAPRETSEGVSLGAGIHSSSGPAGGSTRGSPR